LPLTIVVCLGLGCSSQQKNLEEEQSNLKPLAVLYGQFVGRHQGRPPDDEAQFKQFVQTQGKETLASFGVTDVSSLFVSSRDGKPYVIRYGQQALTGPPGAGGSPVVAYEQEGVDGVRFVATSMGAVERVDEARFKELVPGGP
jgi:hypothetical protein